jgi:SAM-dependent methyltransferase
VADPTDGICDLCGSASATVLLDRPTGPALRSDRVPVPERLRKVRCTCCGLVRGTRVGAAGVYEDEYAVADPDYVFHTPRGPVRRSAAFADWLVSLCGAHRWAHAARVLEVGAGAGAVLGALADRFPDGRFEGVELSRRSVAEARRLGRDVRAGGPEDASAGTFDLVYSIAVLEHVPSPTEFLAALRRRLRPGGLLVLSQPTQDVPGYDVFFVDHLHHFSTPHVRAYARKGGFRELGFVVGHEWMPNFSAHLFQAEDVKGDPVWCGPPAAGCERAAEVSADLARLDVTLSQLGDRRVAVFGLNEVYALARAYSALGRFPIHCGLADRPDDPIHGRHPFPVVAPEAAPGLGVRDVVLAVNTVYYPQLRARLGSLGVAVHPVLSEARGRSC